MYLCIKIKNRLLCPEQTFYLDLFKQVYMILAFLYPFLNFFLNINYLWCGSKRWGSLGSSKCWICNNLGKLSSGGLLKKLWGSAVFKHFAHPLGWIIWNYYNVGCSASVHHPDAGAPSFLMIKAKLFLFCVNFDVFYFILTLDDSSRYLLRMLCHTGWSSTTPLQTPAPTPTGQCALTSTISLWTGLSLLFFCSSCKVLCFLWEGNSPMTSQMTQLVRKDWALHMPWNPNTWDEC